MQHITMNTEYITQDNKTENSTENITQNITENNTNNHAQPQRTFIHTYSLDYYQEYAYIKNNDTIELYTILQDKI